MFDLTGKKALITGASRGIGKGIALCLAKAGADVVVNFHSKPELAEGVVQEIKAFGRNSFSIQADTSQKAEVQKMIAEVISKWGKIDILVNNAGVIGAGNIDEMPEEEWDRLMNVNLKGYFLVTQAVVKEMKKYGGRIINISSVASGQIGFGTAGAVHYGTSKGGVIAFSEGLAAELAPFKINVNSIAPGVIETDMVASITGNEQASQMYLNKIPLKRWGKSEDIGYGAVFLASSEASYITGTVLYIDGGWLSV